MLDSAIHQKSHFPAGTLIGQRCSYIVLAIVCKQQTKDNNKYWSQRSNVNVMHLLQNSQYLWSIFFCSTEQHRTLP